MIRYESNGKHAYFDGLRFTRDDKTGYYLNSATRKRLHRYVWEYHNGEIPPGYTIHHKDHDKSNNEIDNLCILKSRKHASIHGVVKANNVQWRKWARRNLKENAVPEAVKWHKSDEGRRWHKEHYERTKHCLHQSIKLTCEFCGKEYEGVDMGRNRFCSNKCKAAWRRKSGVDDETRTCEYCRHHFTVDKYAKTRTCSRSCANRLRFKIRESKDG